MTVLDEILATKRDEVTVLHEPQVRTLLRAQSPLLTEISEVDVSRPEGPVLYMLDGVEVRLGREDWDDRLGRLGGVLAQLRASGQRATSIDLRFRDQVVLRTAAR